MKKMNLTLIFVLTIFLGTSLVHAQNIVKTSAKHKVSGKAGKPGALIDFTVEKEKGEIVIKYKTKENKRKVQFEKYTYDLATLKEKNMEESEIEKERAFKLFRRYKGGKLMRFVRVRNNMAQQMVLERGYIERTVGNDWATNRFVTEQKEKFKDPQNHRQSLVAYRTDAPTYSFNLNTWSDAFKVGATHRAKGNALIITSVVPKIVKGEIPGAKFNTMVIASEDLSVVSKKELDFEFPHYAITKANLPDGGMAVVFKPLNRGGIGGSDVHPVKQNLNEHTLLTIDKEGNETDRYTFEIKQQHADLDLVLAPNGDFLIYGFADELDVSPSDKKPNCSPIYGLEGLNAGSVRVEAPKTLEMVRLSKSGETIFSTSTPLKKLVETVQSYSDEKVKPPKVKKWDKYFKKEAKKGSIFEVNENLFVQIHSEDNYQLAQFTTEGKFEVSYFTEKEGDKFIESQVIGGPGSSVYWTNFEHDEGKAGEMWMKIAKIDPANKKVQDIQIPGDQKYYLIGDASFASAEGLGEVILYLQDGKKIYLGKLPIE